MYIAKNRERNVRIKRGAWVIRKTPTKDASPDPLQLHVANRVREHVPVVTKEGGICMWLTKLGNASPW